MRAGGVVSPETEKQSERDANQSPAVVLRERGGKTAGWTRKQRRGQRSTAEHDKRPVDRTIWGGSPASCSAFRAAFSSLVLA